MSLSLTAAEVAKRLNVRKGRVYELARIGVLPCFRLGRQVRFDHDQIERWIEGGGRLPEPPNAGAKPTLTPYRR